MTFKYFQVSLFLFVILLVFGCDIKYKLRSEENPNYIEDAINEFNVVEVYSMYHQNGSMEIDILSNYSNKEITRKGPPGDYQIIYGLVDDKDVFLFLPDYINSEEDVLFESPYPSKDLYTKLAVEYNSTSEYQIKLDEDDNKLILSGDLTDNIQKGSCNFQSDNIIYLTELYNKTIINLYLIIGHYYKEDCYIGEVAIVLYKDDTFGIIAANEEYYLELYRS